jgi:hypothetical protein
MTCETSRDSRYWVTASQESMFPRQQVDAIGYKRYFLCGPLSVERFYSSGRGQFGYTEERERPSLGAVTRRLLKTGHADKTVIITCTHSSVRVQYIELPIQTASILTTSRDNWFQKWDLTDQINWIGYDWFNWTEARRMPEDWRKEIKVEIRANNKKIWGPMRYSRGNLNDWTLPFVMDPAK